MYSAVKEGVFPGAVLLAARAEEILLHQAYGYASVIPEKQLLNTETIFDLASLTKPLATSLGIMSLVERGRLSLDQPLGFWWDSTKSPEKQGITLRRLLAHSAGFPAYQPYYLDLIRQSGDKKAILRNWVIKEPLLYPSGSQTLYSDLGFILLEWIFEETAVEGLDAWIPKKCLYSPGPNPFGIQAINPVRGS